LNYEKEPFVQEEPERTYFEMKLVFYGIEEDFKRIDECLCKKHFRVFTWICDEIQRWYMEQIYMKRVYYGGFNTDRKDIGHAVFSIYCRYKIWTDQTSHVVFISIQRILIRFIWISAGYGNLNVSVLIDLKYVFTEKGAAL